MEEVSHFIQFLYLVDLLSIELSVLLFMLQVRNVELQRLWSKIFIFRVMRKVILWKHKFCIPLEMKHSRFE